MAPPLRLLRLGNPVVRTVLRSPLHGLLGGSLVLLEYAGRRSGRTYAIPVLGARDPDGAVVALAAVPGRKQWWRTFRSPAPAMLVVQGERVEVEGRLLTTPDERRAALRLYLQRFPRTSRTLGATADAPNEVLDAVDAALVRFRGSTLTRA